MEKETKFEEIKFDTINYDDAIFDSIKNDYPDFHIWHKAALLSADLRV